jgi:hypothetical protein
MADRLSHLQEQAGSTSSLEGDPPTRKALLQSLADEIPVVRRVETYPSFSWPA